MKILGNTEKILIVNVNALMHSAGWKAKDLAKATGISLQGVYNIIKGERFPGPDNLDRIAKALNCSVSDLFRTKEDERDYSKIPSSLLVKIAPFSPQHFVALERFVDALATLTPDGRDKKKTR